MWAGGQEGKTQGMWSNCVPLHPLCPVPSPWPHPWLLCSQKGGIRPRALPGSSLWSFNPHWHPGSAGTASKGHGCSFVSQSHTDSSQTAARTRSSPARPWGPPRGPQKCGKDPSTSSSALAHVHAPRMQDDHRGMRTRTRGGSEGSNGTPNLSPGRTPTTASLWMLLILLCPLGWDCPWREPQEAAGGSGAGAAAGAVLQYKY